MDERQIDVDGQRIAYMRSNGQGPGDPDPGDGTAG
jgi:hypothetical protein